MSATVQPAARTYRAQIDGDRIRWIDPPPDVIGPMRVLIEPEVGTQPATNGGAAQTQDDAAADEFTRVLDEARRNFNAEAHSATPSTHHPDGIRPDMPAEEREARRQRAFRAAEQLQEADAFSSIRDPAAWQRGLRGDTVLDPAEPDKSPEGQD